MSEVVHDGFAAGVADGVGVGAGMALGVFAIAAVSSAGCGASVAVVADEHSGQVSGREQECRLECRGGEIAVATDARTASRAAGKLIRAGRLGRPPV